jgi:hypothetical protein
VQEIHERVIVTNDMSCTNGSDELAVVHACKSPCHQRAVGYRGNLQKTHPNYLVLENELGMYRKVCKWLKLGTGLQSEWQAG